MWKRILKESEEKAAGTHAAGWLRELRKLWKKEEKSDAQVCPAGDIPLFEKRYGESKDSEPEIRKQVSLVVRMINMLPYWNGNVEYQAVFAAKVTEIRTLLTGESRTLHSLAFILDWFEKQNLPGKMTDTKEAGSAKEHIFRRSKHRKRYLQAGILKDDLSNYTAVYGIRAWKKGGEMHQEWKDIWQKRVPYRFPLRHLPDRGRWNARESNRFCGKSVSIFRTLWKWKGTRSCMCMNGQPRLVLFSCWICLPERRQDLLCGDFDRRGLLIAQS